MTNSRDFYDYFADSYHLIYHDWTSAVTSQGRFLTELLTGFGAGPGSRILDCSCGIGTQAIGLAKEGYQVHATDLSPQAVKRTAKEAKEFGVTLSTAVADFRVLASQVQETFDAVISFDNSLPHLLSNKDMGLAAHNIRQVIGSGIFVASIRDYDEILASRPDGSNPKEYRVDGVRHLYFQRWQWHENQRYTVELFLMIERGSGTWEVKTSHTSYRAWTRDEVSAVFDAAGFCSIKWIMPDESGFYQPIFVCRT